eukprot:m.56311 g.56311  ORF g.56311 m.56311 type:complete len:423 (+) comp6994_c0_seq2:64-1332(+)
MSTASGRKRLTSASSDGSSSGAVPAAKRTAVEAAACTLAHTSGSATTTGRKQDNEDVYYNENVPELGATFSVFDGHGGVECANFLQHHLLRTIRRELLQRDPPPLHCPAAVHATIREQIEECEQQRIALRELCAEDDESVRESMESTLDELNRLQAQLETQLAEMPLERHPGAISAMHEAFTAAFRHADELFCARARTKKIRSGSTCIVGILQGTHPENAHLEILNVGDSRAVLCRGGEAVRLSSDHKPSRRDEARRVRDAGGYVVNIRGISRVTNAGGAGMLDVTAGTAFYLAVSRAFGDVQLKDPPIVVADPEIHTIPLQSDDLFVILACDGIWDVCSDQQAVNEVLKTPDDPERAANALLNLAYAQGSQDNLTATVVRFSWVNFKEAHVTLSQQLLEAAEAEDAATANEDDDEEDDMFA